MMIFFKDFFNFFEDIWFFTLKVLNFAGSFEKYARNHSIKKIREIKYTLKNLKIGKFGILFPKVF